MERSSTVMRKRENRSIVQTYFDALGEGDMDKLGSIFADDIVWHQPGESRLSGTYYGKELVMELLAKFMDISGGSFQIDSVEAVMDNRDLVAAILHFKAERPGKSMSMKGVDLMRVENGKIKEVWLFSSDLEAEDRFWG